MTSRDHATAPNGRRLVGVSPTGFVGGAESSLLSLLELARRSGWTATAVVPEGAYSELVQRAGFAVEHIPDLRIPSGSRVRAAIVIAARLVEAARVIRRATSEADLVLANGTRTLPAIALARVSCPVIHLVRDVITRRSWRIMLSIFGRKATFSIAPSEPGARPLRERDLPVTVVHHGVDWPVAPATSEPDAAPVLGITANLTPLKGQHVALEALALLDRHDVVLELAGAAFGKDLAYEQRLHERASQPDLTGRVRFLGYRSDILEVMRAWRVALLPGVLPDTAPLSLLEAMSLGIPVVASDLGGPTELLGDAGLLVAPDDPGALARAITRLLDDPALYTRCAEAGRRAVARHFNRDRENAELLAILDEVASTRHAPVRTTRTATRTSLPRRPEARRR
jgi:glycosyltransferase involved in cell wall biosynthesis